MGAYKVLLQFDRSMNKALAEKVKNRLTFKAGKLHTYRFCDNVWTFLLSDVEFRDIQELAKGGTVKIVACDGKSKTLVLFLSQTFFLTNSYLFFCFQMLVRTTRKMIKQSITFKVCMYF